MKVWFRGIIYISIVAVTGFGGYVGLNSNFFRVSDVRFEFIGDVKDKYLYDRIYKDLKGEMTASLQEQSLWFVDLPSILAKIKNDQRVSTVQAIKKFPSGIVLKVRPRRPIGLLLTANGAFFPLGIDGGLLPRLDKSLVPDLPLIRGKSFFNQEKLRKEVVELLADIPKAGIFSLENLSEIHRSSGGEYEIYLTEPAVLVEFIAEDFKYKVSMIIRVLEYLQTHGLRGRVIDARFSKKVVVRLHKQP